MFIFTIVIPCVTIAYMDKTTKTCSRCGNAKELNDFGKNKNTKDGLSYWCRQCKSLSDKRYITKPGGGKRIGASEVDKELFANGKKAGRQPKLVVELGPLHIYPQPAYMQYGTKEFKQRNKNYRLMRKYGITLEEYELLYEEQNGKCFICSHWYAVLHIDHCHSTGIVRKLLCNGCNTGLGLFRESIPNLRGAINYLELFQVGY